MAIKLLNAVSTTSVSAPIKTHKSTSLISVAAEFKSLAATTISAVTIAIQGSMTDEDGLTGVVSNPTLAVGSTAEQFANNAFDYIINGTNYTKAAVAAGSVFSAAHVITASKWGAINIYIDSAGDFLTQVPVSPQAYTTAALAHAAADVILTPPGYVYVGRILIENNVGDWTANTDDLTDASDITTATFLSSTSSYINLVSHVFTAGEITAQRAFFQVNGYTAPYVRLYLSTLTGTGTVTAHIHPCEVF